MSKKLIILASSRSNGHTRQVVDYLLSKGNYDVIDLLEYNIGYYDYTHSNKEDDYLPLMHSITTKYDTFIFATPVYWYTMSAQLKTFFDRISDLLQTEKELGRTLRGKKMAMISCSGDDDRNPHFAEPFQLSASYLGMQYMGDVHTYIENQNEIPDIVLERLDEFHQSISQNHIYKKR